MKRDARQEGLRWLEQAEADRYGAQLLFDGASYHLACCARLPLIPPALFSHTGRRGSLSVLKPRVRKGTQGRLKNHPVQVEHPHTWNQRWDARPCRKNRIFRKRPASL